MGCLALVMAMGTFSLRRGAPWRVWLSVIMLISLVLSLGEYTSPIWATRVLAAVTKQPALEELVRELGPLDKDDATPIRLDRYLRDGDGSVYWWMSAILPGFRQFRFPAKLFTFVSLALAVLAGMGWDELRGRDAPGHRDRGVVPRDEPGRAGRRVDREGADPGRSPIVSRDVAVWTVRSRRRLCRDRPQPAANVDRPGAWPGCRPSGPDATADGRSDRADRRDGRPGRGQRPLRPDGPAILASRPSPRSPGSSRMPSGIGPPTGPTAFTGCPRGTRWNGWRIARSIGTWTWCPGSATPSNRSTGSTTGSSTPIRWVSPRFMIMNGITAVS